MDCKFCQDLQEVVALHERGYADMVAGDNSIESARSRYRVSLRIQTVLNGTDRGMQVSGAYKIRYCPSCGRRIRKEELDDGSGYRTRHVGTSRED